MNEKINIHKANSNLLDRIEYLNKWELNNSLKQDLILFLQDLRNGKVNKGVRVSERTCCKYISLLKAPLLHYAKPLKNLKKSDIENFDNGIARDTIKSEKKKPYSYNMKINMRIAIKTFLGWKLGKVKAEELTENFDTREKEKTPDYLKEIEIEKLFKACKTAQERYLIAVLFDGGCRAEEFLNIRFEDIQMPEGKENFVKITLKEEYSKTMGRTISLFWRYSLEAVRDYVSERIKEGMKSNEQIYTQTYDATRFFLMRLGQRALKRSIHFHLFRHSSATYYSSKLNRQELCYRYGWKFSSNMPDVYISRSGMMNKELEEKFISTELGELKSQLEEEKAKNAIEIEQLKKTLSEVVEKGKMIVKIKG